MNTCATGSLSSSENGMESTAGQASRGTLLAVKQGRRRGFTLLEVLLGMVLSIALLTGLWASLNLYTKIFSSGHTEVEQSQLIHGLLSKISVELRAAVPPPKSEALGTSTTTEDSSLSPGVPASFNSSAALGLRGDAHSIEIDLVQPLVQAPRTSDVDSAAANEMSTPAVPELVTVRYYITEEDLMTPVADGVGTAEAAGLVRYAYPWAGHPGAEDEVSSGTISSSQLSSSLPDTAATREEEALPPGFRSSEAGENLPQLLAAEVVQLEFRYYDGQFWSSQWDSQAQGSLPLAVEVAVAVPRPQTATPDRPSGGANGTTSDDALSTDVSADLRGVSLFETASNTTASAAEQLPWIVSRRLVALPLGGKTPEGLLPTGDESAEPATDSGTDDFTQSSESGTSGGTSSGTSSDGTTTGVQSSGGAAQ